MKQSIIFQDLTEKLSAGIKLEEQTTDIQMGMETEVRTIQITDAYVGSYTVIPSTTDQTLATQQKLMTSNVTVKQVPIREVSNEYGTTIIIG